MFAVYPIGYIRKENGVFIEILPEFLEAVDGLSEGDWIKVIAWLHESDTPEKRKVLKVHPRGNPRNPLTGVFATRSPLRPNPFALYTVRIERIEGNKLYISWVDAYEGTPVLDIRIFVKRLDCPSEIERREVNKGRGVRIGEINLIPRKSNYLGKLEEVSPEEFEALTVEIGPKTAVLSAEELCTLIKTLKKIYEELPVEIRGKLGCLE
ncbi:tRNA (N6-threonylcarbamoyladenosine(37)-N6)-methyltransferase TrmO [Pyrococcus kukulkanii]|uniref:tRNA (N6-threonylcarbamoyladenosine(37)-N6)-methyltransferase TrmO n=1 Tax=Pyrococcus kukulkanii TaxID=1609559 RepID=UPI000F2B2F6F|nr:MAG: tRNA (N6-threonylcarbamoyladenosine(37)-N6)-methyltransferase TrmO [Thermococci archaeon]